MAGAPDVPLLRLQSILNATVRLVFSARKFDHTTPLLCELHWLKVPERVRFRLCVLNYRCLTGTAPHYFAETICPVPNLGARQHLQSAESSTLLVPSTRGSTPGDRSFQVAALPTTTTYIWNAPSLSAEIWRPFCSGRRFLMRPDNVPCSTEIFGVRKLESLGYCMALFAWS